MARKPLCSFAAVSVPIYLLLLLLIASLFRSNGLVVFVIGLAALTASWGFLLRGRRRFLFATYLTAILLGALTVGLELTLWLRSDLLHGMVANYALGRFHTHSGGIFDTDEHMGTCFKQNFVCSMYFNGHRWTHECNALGYRGPALERADVVFLGDSLIYGHGVETNQAVPHSFQMQTGLTSANLGIPGTGFITAWMRFKRMGIDLKPKFVFLCSCYNDIVDITHHFADEELERFLASAVDDDTEPMARAKFRPLRRRPQQFWNDNLALPLRSAGAISVLGHSFKLGLNHLADPVAAIPDVSFAARKWEISTGSEKLAWQAHRHALRKIQYLCQKNGAALIVFDFGAPTQFSEAIEALARENGLIYHPAGRIVFQESLTGEDRFLANDGHWSPQGCHSVARALAREFLDEGSRPQPDPIIHPTGEWE